MSTASEGLSLCQASDPLTIICWCRRVDVVYINIPNLCDNFVKKRVSEIRKCRQLQSRACFKKNSPLHIWPKNLRTTFFRNCKISTRQKF